MVEAYEKTGDCVLRSYRLALACTGEYSSFHGGTTSGAASAMTTTLNRINGIFEEDCYKVITCGEITILNLSDGASDPYTNGNFNLMMKIRTIVIVS
ncbi:MAG: hypothetical protein R2795_12560 [Saprospiraceae bacterium]